MNQKQACDMIEQLETKHAKQIKLTQSQLLKGIPKEGGIFGRAILRAMIKSAFIGGVVSERFDKIKPGKN
jgi:hypothetical protein